MSLALPRAASAVCTPAVTLTKYDDETAMLSDGGGGFVQQSQWVAQSFVVPGASELSSVSLFLENLAPSGDTVTAQVRSDANGLPGDVLGQVTTSTTNTTSYDWLVFEFSSLGLQLVGGAPYWIVASNPITDNGQGYAWQEAFPSAVYPSGISRFSSNQGASWGSPLNSDYGFRVLGCVPSVTSPPNAFSFGKLRRNKKAGTATLRVNVPGPGTLSLTGKGVVKQRPGFHARTLTSKAVAGAGKVTLRIKAKGKKKAKLNETGKVQVKVKITYTPSGGTANSKAKKIRLKKTL